jgi:uncharacterized protein YegL
MSEMEKTKIEGGHFQFSAVGVDRLEATEYTLVGIAVDETGSTAGFQENFREMLVAAVESCKKSPRRDNLLIRVIKFSTAIPENVEEIHGFKPLAEIEPNDYPHLNPDGMTPLYDATLSVIGSVNTYAKTLMNNEFLTNGIVFIVTDGIDNDSVVRPEDVRENIQKALQEEWIESLITILVGINTVPEAVGILEEFQQKAGLDHYIDMGEVSEAKLAKLANFISKSISSQSQSLGTGGPSKDIGPAI